MPFFTNPIYINLEIRNITNSDRPYIADYIRKNPLIYLRLNLFYYENLTKTYYRYKI